MTLDDILFLLHGFKTEKNLEPMIVQELAKYLNENQVSYHREHVISKHARLDFFLPEHGIAIEVKTASNAAEVTRQIFNYAQHEIVKGIVLISNQQRHRQLPDNIAGKAIHKIIFTQWF